MHGPDPCIRPGFHHDKRTRVGLLSNASRYSHLSAFHPARNRRDWPDPLGLERPTPSSETKPCDRRKSHEPGRECEMNIGQCCSDYAAIFLRSSIRLIMSSSVFTSGEN